MHFSLGFVCLLACVALSNACSSGGSKPGPDPIPPKVCGQSYAAQSRIISGADAKPGAWPWMASLWLYGTSHICGGTIINPKWILTASHCVVGTGATKSSLMIKLGEHDHRKKDGAEQLYRVARIIPHGGYDARQLKNDIALIELERPALFNKRVVPICLPSKGSRPAVGSQKCYLSGWGSIQHPGPAHNILQQAMLPVAPYNKCFYRKDMVCAGSGGKTTANACRGDSGGPYVCQRSDGTWEQHGVASFVTEYCKYYTAFTPVGDYLDWMNQYINA